MNKIEHIIARKILDSSGEYTVETEIVLKNGLKGVASVASGISEGQWEAKTVTADQAIRELKEVILPAINNKEFVDQNAFDQVLKHLPCSANASLSVSIAFCRVAKSLSFPKKIVSPKLLVLLFEGGKHGSKNLTIQEFMVVVEKVEEGIERYRKVRLFLDGKGLPTTVGAEGGFSPPGIFDTEVLEILKKVLGEKQPLALDIAASSAKKQSFDYQKLIEDHSIVLLEDPYPDDDWTNWTNLNNRIGKKVLIVSDDLTATSPLRIREAAQGKAVGGVVIKPDQRRTLTEVLEAVKTAKENGLKIIVSHRGKETNDSFIVDLAVAIEADFVKFGAPVRGERVAKYNRLFDYQRGDLITYSA